MFVSHKNKAATRIVMVLMSSIPNLHPCCLVRTLCKAHRRTLLPSFLPREQCLRCWRPASLCSVSTLCLTCEALLLRSLYSVLLSHSLIPTALSF